MSLERNTKVSIVGAGSVGTAIAYASFIRGGAGQIALYDLDAKKVRAEVLDLNHGRQFVPHCRVTGSDDLDVTAGSAVIVVTDNAVGTQVRVVDRRCGAAGSSTTLAGPLAVR